MQDKFTRQAANALKLAKTTAQSCNHSYIGTEHILVGLLKEKEGTAGRILEEFNVEEDALRQLIEELIAPSEVLAAEKAPEYSPRAMRVLEKSVQEAENQKEAQAGTEHLLVAMLKETDCVATRLLYTMGVNIQKLYVAVLTAMGIENPTAEELQGGRNQKTQKSGAVTPTLDQYSRDLTEMARQGVMDPVVGREDEIGRVIQILSRRTKNNPCLIGEPGVGKTECAKFLTTFIPEEEKVITVEDTLELHYHEINPGKDCMEIRVNEHYSYADAMSTVLRLTPKRVMLSETRSIEVKYLIQCWTTGISGFTTLHTDDVRKIPDRILNMLENKQDAERLENDVYVGMDVGVLLETRYDPQKEIYERYISQIGFFSRENGKNYCNLIVRNGKLENEDIVLPEDIELRMEKSGISNAFYCEELEELMKKESLEAVS